MYDRLTQLLEPVAGLFDVASVEAMALRLVGAVLVLLAAFWISTTAQRYLVRRLHGHDEGQEETIRLYRRVVQVFVWVMGVGIALHTLGIDLTHLFTAGGLVAVGLAFVMKTLVENLVSGLIPRLERVIKHGDVLFTSDGETVRSELNEAIWWALKDADVVIAFPQLDVHIAPDASADTSR